MREVKHNVFCALCRFAWAELLAGIAKTAIGKARN